MIGETLKKYLPVKGDQKAAAARWIEVAAPFEREPPKLDTVASHLSRCLHEDLVGVRYFFSTDRYARALLDTLQVPIAVRPAIFKLADEMLATGQARPAKVVIDLTPWNVGGDDATRLFDALKPVFLNGMRASPTLLVVTEAQYDRLPRSFDDLGDDLRTERVGPDERVDLDRFAGRSALVASKRVFASMHRWVAMEWNGKELVIDPPDALSVFAREGQLPAPPVPVHALPELGTPSIPKPLPGSAIEVRKLAFALGDEEAASKLAERVQRRAWADALGVLAASTERERVELELEGLARDLDKTPRTTSSDELERQLRRAARQPVEMTVLRVADEIHIINPPDDLAARIAPHPRARIVSFDPPAPIITQILQDWRRRDWSEDDAIDDPFLDRLVVEWEEKEDPPTVRHAFATLALAQKFAPSRKIDPVEDWRTPLSQILSGDPPPASLLIRNPRVPPQERDARRAYDEQRVSQFLVPRPRLAAADTDSTRARDPIAPLLLRHEAMALVSARHVSGEERRREMIQHKSATEPSIVVDTASADDVDKWFRMLDESPSCHGHYPTDAADHYRAIVRIDWQERSHMDPPWSSLDRELGIQWLVLRRALLCRESVRLQDGTVLIPVGPSAVIELQVRAHRTPGPATVAALEGQVHVGSGELTLVTETSLRERTSRDERGPYTTAYRSSYDAPLGLRLAGNGVVASVRYRAAPMLSGRPSRSVPGASESEADE